MYCSCKASKLCELFGSITVCSFQPQHKKVNTGGLGEGLQSYAFKNSSIAPPTTVQPGKLADSVPEASHLAIVSFVWKLHRYATQLILRHSSKVHALVTLPAG